MVVLIRDIEELPADVVVVFRRGVATDSPGFGAQALNA
jgi:hypothetical protein